MTRMVGARASASRFTTLQRRSGRRLALNSASMPYEFVLTEVRGPVGIVTINRPQVRNALNHQTIAELVDALDAFDRDDRVRCMILTGDDRAFAAGADISQMVEAGAGGGAGGGRRGHAGGPAGRPARGGASARKPDRPPPATGRPARQRSRQPGDGGAALGRARVRAQTLLPAVRVG